MEKSEAINKIQEFQNIINSSNKIFISSKHMLIVGFCLMAIPFLEVLTQGLTFGFELNETLSAMLPGLKAAFYGVLFWSFFIFFPDKKAKESSLKENPILKKTFGIQFPFIIALVSVGIGLGFTNNGHLAYPLVFIFLGIFYNLLGRFSNPSLITVSWLYIIAGPLFMYLLQYKISYLWEGFMIFHALTCLYIGLYTRKLEFNREARN